MADKMEAGREMDLRVAKVMKFLRVEGGSFPTYWKGNAQCPLPRLSIDVAAAWEVVERLRDKGFIVKISVDAPENSELVSCSLHKPDLYETMVGEWIDDTMPLAVCGAALKLEGLDA